MSLPASASLSNHFDAWELGADAPGIPSNAQANLYKVAAWLESLRVVAGNRAIYVNGSRGHNRGYRAPATNVSVGGSDTSDHVNGLAADFNVDGVSMYKVVDFAKSGVLPPFDQIIIYPLDGHVHVGLGAKMRGEIRVAVAEGGFPLLTPETLAKLRGASPLIILLVIVLLLIVARKGGA
jgi:zinc D-Ala-D-Ala carboxypeptidase